MRTAFTMEMVDDLEQQLKLSLRPVHPDQEFVTTLQTRLSNPVTMQVEPSQPVAFAMLMIAFSMFTGAFLILLLRQLRRSTRTT